MTDVSRYPSRAAAFEAGRRVGTKEEHERLLKEGKPESDAGDPARLTLDDIRAGKLTDDELIARKDEIDALLAGERT
jgi:hypothetical protein